MPSRLTILLLIALHTGLRAEVSPEHRQFFETKIRPVLVRHCYDCHSAKKMAVSYTHLTLPTNREV